MNGRRLATAITLVCALTVLASPAQSYAAPKPDPKPPVSSKALEDVRKQIDDLYHQAAVATDAYNLAEEQTEKQSAELTRLAREVMEGQERIDRLKEQMGATARAQYRTGGLPPGTQLMLSGDPGSFLDGATLFRHGQQATKGLLSELTRAQEDLTTYSADASTHLQQLEANRAAKDKAKKEITRQIAAAEKLESRLEKEERERLRKLEEEAQHKAQTAWLNSGALAGVGGKATAGGKKAVAYATAQIGKPYVWGAEGPDSFDCSGLTSQAWEAAGRGIPRTSQEQWRRLPHVSVKDMRPGDLIVYYKDATHIGMYVGGGMIVHAPRPGRDVTVAGAGSMPILGVVRPDAG
ncbi:C40 family peptidase [Streptomyces sannanensis]|uniref:C40 family peptidase n=1 Tax=Streptomyces sannanensis TaxID=285536 RepID=A0ABP6SBR9_9ACTN